MSRRLSALCPLLQTGELKEAYRDWVEETLPQHFLMGIILLLCLVGTYSVNNSMQDLYILIVMGVVGYILRKFKFDMAPLVLALVLGPMLEKSLGKKTAPLHTGET